MCGRVEHRVTAVSHGAVASLFAYQALPPIGSPIARVALTLALGLATAPTSGGRWSPDCDQFARWKKWDRRIPDELLGFGGGPLRHRGLSHWWGLPAAVTWALAWACQHLPLLLALLLLVLTGPQLLGWWSHLWSDLWIGGQYLGGKRPEADDPAGAWDRKSTMDADDHPRGPGIPVFPWWGHVGLGYRVGSIGEWVYVLATTLVGAAAVYGAWRGVDLPDWTPAAALFGAGTVIGLGTINSIRGLPARSRARRATRRRIAA
mgnify:CR=1 FL=1